MYGTWPTHRIVLWSPYGITTISREVPSSRL